MRSPIIDPHHLHVTLLTGSLNSDEPLEMKILQPPFHNSAFSIVNRDSMYHREPAAPSIYSALQPPLHSQMTEFPWLPVTSANSYALPPTKPYLPQAPRLVCHYPRESVICHTVGPVFNPLFPEGRITFKQPQTEFYPRRSVIQPSLLNHTAIFIQEKFERGRASSLKQLNDGQLQRHFRDLSIANENSQSAPAFNQSQNLPYSKERETGPNISAIYRDPKPKSRDFFAESVEKGLRHDQGRNESLNQFTGNLNIPERDILEEIQSNEIPLEEKQPDELEAKEVNNCNEEGAIGSMQLVKFPGVVTAGEQQDMMAYDHSQGTKSKSKHVCDECGRTFTRSSTLVTHKHIHTGDKPYVCKQCGRAFRQLSNLTRHQLTHTTSKPYICQQCNKAFNRASNLHTHMRTHSDYKPLSCEFCGKRFHQKVDMKIHRYTHTGEKPHKCQKCGRGFKQLTHLTYHMRTHSDVRMYKCEFCGKGFNQKGNLKAHVYRHTGERPFKCDICDKGFTLASTLNTHKRTHAPHKPFQCQYCEKAFYQKNALKSHYIASHPFTGGVSLL